MKRSILITNIPLLLVIIWGNLQPVVTIPQNSGFSWQPANFDMKPPMRFCSIVFVWIQSNTAYYNRSFSFLHEFTHSVHGFQYGIYLTVTVNEKEMYFLSKLNLYCPRKSKNLIERTAAPKWMNGRLYVFYDIWLINLKLDNLL